MPPPPQVLSGLKRFAMLGAAGVLFNFSAMAQGGNTQNASGWKVVGNEVQLIDTTTNVNVGNHQATEKLDVSGTLRLRQAPDWTTLMSNPNMKLFEMLIDMNGRVYKGAERPHFPPVINPPTPGAGWQINGADVVWTNRAVGISTNNPGAGFNLDVVGNMRVSGSGLFNDKIITRRLTSPDSLLYLGDSSIVIFHNSNNIRVDNNRGLGLGTQAYAVGRDAVSMGFAVQTDAENSVTIGCGPIFSSGYLVNNIPNSVMIGANSTLPTIFVAPAFGSTTGNVGFGTTSPEEKIHLQGISPAIKLTNDGAAGNEAVDFTIKAHNGDGRLITDKSIIFFINGDNNDNNQRFSIFHNNTFANTPAEEIFKVNENGNTFIKGDLGVGTMVLGKKLEVEGNAASPNGIRITNYVPTLYFKNKIYTNGHDWHISVAEVGTNATFAIKDETANAYRLTIDGNGNMNVCGTIRAKKVIVEPVTGCDYVFEKNYDLLSIEKRKETVLKNKHLPNIQPAKDMEKNGADMGELSTGLLQTAEEHELYLYQLDERIEKLEKENALLKKKIEYLINRLNESK